MIAMPANVNHFAINCDDVERAKQFYESVFHWEFNAWGPPDFYQITTGSDADVGIRGALQKRRELVEGRRMTGFENTISVANIDVAIMAIEAAGGKIVMPKAVIPTVGALIFFEDTEGNIAGAMQYEAQPK